MNDEKAEFFDCQTSRQNLFTLPALPGVEVFMTMPLRTNHWHLLIMHVDRKKQRGLY